MKLSAPALQSWMASRSLAWAGALLALVVVVLTTAFLFHEEQALERAELQSAELYARVLQDHAERTFNTIDISMGALTDSLGAQLRSNQTTRLGEDLARAVGGMPFLRSISLVDPRGRVVASSTASNEGVTIDLQRLKLPVAGVVEALGSSVAGRDLSDIAAGRASADPGSRTFVPLVRTLPNPPGETLHIVAVLNPDFFANAYELTLADASRAAGIFSIDGTMLAGTGNLTMAPGQSARGHGFFTAFLPARENGSFVGPGIDGSRVVTAFRVLRKRPIAILVERSSAQILVGFNQTLRLTLGAAGIALALILTTVVLGWRSLRSREAVQATLDATRLEIAVSERDLRTLVESVHELIFRADASGRIVFVNGRWAELTRRPASDAIGKRVTDLCRDDEAAACLALFSKPGTNDETMLVHVLDAAGGQLTLDLSVSRLLDAEGRTIGYAGFAVDVSQREAAQQALQSQLKFTAQLLEVSPTPIFVKDVKGLFVTVNRAWLDLMNLQLPDVLGRSSADLFGADAGKHEEQDGRLLESEERISYENRHQSPGREPRDTIVTKVRFTRADGAPAGIVGSIVDVTEFREAERHIRQARDAAELANSAKSEFIANISHELRTPLQGIIGFSELGRDLAAEQPDFLDMFADIYAGGQRMLTLVNGLLDVSQMDGAIGSVPLQRADVAQLVRQAVGQLQPKAVVRDLSFKLAGLDAPVECDVDAVRFQQAVRNVLANAVRYSPVGTAIDVALTNLGADGVALTVRDRGPGVPVDELETIFDAFVQSSRTRDGSGGTGLGLTISRKIMSAHRGRVVASNADGGGAVFSLTLPAPGALDPSDVDPAAQDAQGRLLASEVT